MVAPAFKQLLHRSYLGQFTGNKPFDRHPKRCEAMLGVQSANWCILLDSWINKGSANNRMISTQTLLIGKAPFSYLFDIKQRNSANPMRKKPVKSSFVLKLAWNAAKAILFIARNAFESSWIVRGNQCSALVRSRSTRCEQMRPQPGLIRHLSTQIQRCA